MRAIPLTALTVVAIFAALPAFAQKPLSESNIRSGAPKAPLPGRKSEPPPAAVPGARARADSVAPAERGAADLPPTEALFDAINRGDIVTARDALSRGADLDGTNLLGLTPLELSVDLARNDISFLLLSMRGNGGGSAGARPPPGQVLVQKPPSAAERRRAQVANRAPPQVLDKADRQTATAARAAPALFAGNGGTAVPSAGFLGFDPRR